MLAIIDFWAFIGAVFLFLALPGPGTFCLLSSTGRGGVRAGYACLAGLILADQILLWLAVAGLAALFVSHPLMFRTLQSLGAIYLIYLGVRLIVSRSGASVTLPFSQLEDFRRGFLVTLMNPKAILFYLAFLPLFIDRTRQPGWFTFVVMAVCIALATVLYCSLIIFVGQRLASALAHHRRIGQWGRRIAGGFLVGFGIRLTVS